MKIIYVSDSTLPSRAASSIHVMKMCEAFAKQGHEVLLLTPNRKTKDSNTASNIYSFYGVDNCFRIVKLPWLNVKGRSIIYGINSAILSKINFPDLVYGRYLMSCYYAAALKIPVIFESHQPVLDSGNMYDKFFASLLQSQYLKRVIVISNELKKYYQCKYDIKSHILHVAHDAADIKTCASEPVIIDNGTLNVGYIGQLYPGKGMELISQLIMKAPWALFHIIGGLEKDIEKWRKELDGYGNVKFHGFIPHGQVNKYINSMDILLAPYQSKVEGHGGGDISKWMSPLKIFEYMAAGKPILCSDLPVLREILTHEDNALLCESDNVDVWMEALTRLNNDRTMMKKLGLSAYRKLIENHTWAMRAEKVLDNLCQDNDLKPRSDRLFGQDS